MSNGHDSSIVEWDDLPGWVSRLEGSARSLLEDALRHVRSADHEQDIVNKVREALAEESPGREAVAVVFGTSEWDNGYFLTATGTVLFVDKSTEDIEFDYIDEVFTEEFGVRGDRFGLSVQVRTGEVDTDDYINHLYEQHGFPDPWKR